MEIKCLNVWLSLYFHCVEVEEVKRRQHCLMFSSAGSQAQTYFVNFDTLPDYQRWHRQASKVSKEHRACGGMCMRSTIFLKLFSFSSGCLFPAGFVHSSEMWCRPVLVEVAPRRLTGFTNEMFINSGPRVYLNCTYLSLWTHLFLFSSNVSAGEHFILWVTVD